MKGGKTEKVQDSVGLLMEFVFKVGGGKSWITCQECALLQLNDDTAHLLERCKHHVPSVLLLHTHPRLVYVLLCMYSLFNQYIKISPLHEFVHKVCVVCVLFYG